MYRIVLAASALLLLAGCGRGGVGFDAYAGTDAPYQAPPSRVGYQTGGYGYGHGGGYTAQPRRVRIEPQGLSSAKYRCDAATARPASPGNAWCDPD